MEELQSKQTEVQMIEQQNKNRFLVVLIIILILAIMFFALKREIASRKNNYIY